MSEVIDDSGREALHQEVNRWIQNALGALKAGKLGDAKDLFLRVVSRAPAFADGYYNLGVICDLEHEPEQAIRYYTQALKHNAQHAECLTNMGAAHSNAGRYSIAIPFFKRAITSNPNLIQPRVNLGITYRHLEQPAQALETLSAAAQMDPSNAYILYLAGCAAQESGRPTEAERFCKAALHCRPNYTDAALLLVDVLIEMENAEEAVSLLEGFMGQNPNDATAGECLLRIRQSFQAG